MDKLREILEVAYFDEGRAMARRIAEKELQKARVWSSWAKTSF